MGIKPVQSFRLLFCIVGACLLETLPASAQEQEPAAYSADMAAFIETIDSDYPFLDLKGIRAEWEAAKPDLTARAAACASDEAFLGIVLDALKCLRDGHVALRETRVPLPRPLEEFTPGLGFMPASGDRVIAMAGMKEGPAAALPPGTVITRIDGEPARARLETDAEKAWKQGGYFSSPQRARLFAYRIPLRGPQGTIHTLAYETDDGEREITLTCEVPARGWPHVYNLPPDLAPARGDVHHARLASGVAYLYLRRVNGDETAEGLRHALAACGDAKGCIVDLRGNGGGGYGESLLAALEDLPRPVALILDAGCVSAGETLARDVQRITGARSFGATTGGSSSAKRQWRFPSGIATVTLPTRSRWRNDGQPIEFNGIVPDVPLEPEPEEVRAGLNSEILRAEQYVIEEAAKQKL
jgi:hypothetical protein